MNRSRLRRFGRLLFGPVVLLLVLADIAFAGPLSATAKSAVENERQNSSLYLQNLRVISFQQSTYTVSEGSAINIEVEISASPAVTATVEYLTLDGTARAGVDYFSTSGVLTFDPNDTLQTFQVQTIEDSIFEGDKTVNLVLRNPTGDAELDPNNDTAVLIIEDDEDKPTNTPVSATATPVFVDKYEPNNTLQTAFPTAAGAAPLCDATLWPVGDLDYYSFVGKDGAAYEVLTSDLDPGLDTVLTLFNAQGNVIATNDDFESGSRASKITFSAGYDGFFYARVVNNSPSDPANLTYCFEVNQIQGTATPTRLPTATRVPGADICEYNGDFDSACLMGANDTLDMNFVPLWGEGPDNDFYRLWVKPGLLYTCQTFDLSSVNDTNMILYDQNRNGLGGNDDKAPGDFGSEVSYFSTYTGWLFILVGPHAPPEYSLSFLYTYSLQCTEIVATPTPLPPPTFPPSGGGFITRPPTATPTAVTTPSPTPIPGPTEPTAPPPTATPNVQVVPFPTQTPVAAAQQTINLDLTVYFDANLNYTAELTEGVEEVAVAIYDNVTNELLAFGYTNEAGAIRFSSLVVSGAIRISVPFLQFNQVVVGDSTIQIRIAPLMQLSDGP